MNKQLLMSLINCSDGESVNQSKFLSSHPDTPTLRSQLKVLSEAKYITVLYSDDDIEEIAINSKALNQR